MLSDPSIYLLLIAISTRGLTRCYWMYSSDVVTFMIDLYGTLSNEEAWREEIFLKRVAITAFRTLLSSYLMTERLGLNRVGGGKDGGLQ